jgi:hypothetical protein
MTAQFPDIIRYQGEEYAIIGVKGGDLLTPKDFGMEVATWHTGCYRGYVATFECVKGELFLTELQIGGLLEGSEWKTINGVQPHSGVYRNLNVETYFSGGILIASGFINALYVHMGFGKPYQFECVCELLFHEGTLVEEIDRSAEAAAWRDHVLRLQEERRRQYEDLKNAGLSDEEIFEQLIQSPSEEKLRKGIEWRFSLDYDEWF